ncbi:hypothetical protein [Nocardioides sp. Soil805]|uniref:hypothetical protein n=1 Tax=Nocardioides sp. Soil805 TaxID=1736416 RepID=UPI0007024D07|nr:hypothetical protein [Nocardioides sp. Soil805]KRF32395.1 hypothetical protein ASG94_18190 [Nocardioides sp. Soil805]
MDALNTREWASVCWVAVLVLAAVAYPPARRALSPLARQIGAFWQLHVTLLLFLGWVALVCFGAHLIGAWNRHLLKDTIVWVVVYGVAAIFSALRAGKEKHFFRRAVLAAVSVGALMQFLLNLHTFAFVIELALLPLVTSLFILEAVARTNRKTRPAQSFFNLLLTILGLWIIVATTRGLLASWKGLDPEEKGLEFAFSLWFPLAMLPFVYFFSLVLTYSANLSRARFHNDDKPPSLGARVALILGLHGDLQAVNDLPRHHAEYRAIVRSRSLREGLTSVRLYKEARAQAQRLEEEAAARLVRNAGLKGVDDDGRALDQREFEQTREALRWIQTCHLGHYNNRGRYRPDLMSGVLLDDFKRQGLPHDHGITMRVSRNGQGWFAWRRTPSGLVLGIAMDEGRENEWLYAGELPPQDFPGADPTWGDQPHETPPDWR